MSLLGLASLRLHITLPIQVDVSETNIYKCPLKKMCKTRDEVSKM